MESSDLQSWEVNFAYVEDGEKKNALVKVRLCKECSYKLNYKKQQKRAEHKSNADRVDTKDPDEKGSGSLDNRRPIKRPSRRHHRGATSKVETADARLDELETRSASKSYNVTRSDDLNSRSSSAASAERGRREQASSEEKTTEEDRDSNTSRKRRAEDDAEPSFDDLLL